MGTDRIVEELQYRAPLQTQRLHYGQDALHEAAASGTVGAKRAPTPQHSAALRALHVIVGRFNAGRDHKGSTGPGKPAADARRTAWFCDPGSAAPSAKPPEVPTTMVSFRRPTGGGCSRRGERGATIRTRVFA